MRYTLQVMPSIQTIYTFFNRAFCIIRNKTIGISLISTDEFKQVSLTHAYNVTAFHCHQQVLHGKLFWTSVQPRILYQFSGSLQRKINVLKLDEYKNRTILHVHKMWRKRREGEQRQGQWVCTNPRTTLWWWPCKTRDGRRSWRWAICYHNKSSILTCHSVVS